MGQTTLITGSSTGIGRATTTFFRAAIDGSDELRYVAGNDAREMLADRSEVND